MAGRRDELATEVYLSERLRAFVFERGSVMLLHGDRTLRLTDAELKKLVSAHGRLVRRPL